MTFIPLFQGSVSKYGQDKSSCPYMFRRPCLFTFEEIKRVSKDYVSKVARMWLCIISVNLLKLVRVFTEEGM